MRNVLVPSLLLAALLAACGGNAPQTPFTVVMRSHPDLERHRTALAESYSRTTGGELDLLLLPRDDYDQHMMKLLADRVAAPPVLVETDRPALLAHLKAALPFTEVLDGWTHARTDELFGDFIRMRTGPDGVLYAVNLHYPEPRVLVASAGRPGATDAEPPVTVTELLAAAERAAGRGRVHAPYYGLGWDRPMPHLLLKAADGGLITYDTGAGRWIPAFTSSMALRELTSLAALYRAGAVPPAVFDASGGHGGADLFRAGRLRFLITDTRTALALYREPGSAALSVSPLPRGTVKPAGGDAAAWCRTSGAFPPERVAAFLEWWYGPASDLLARSAADARIPSWLRTNRHAAPADSGIIAVLHRIASHERIRFTDYHRMPEIREIVDRYWAYAVTDSMRPEDAVAAAVDEIGKKQLLR